MAYIKMILKGILKIFTNIKKYLYYVPKEFLGKLKGKISKFLIFKILFPTVYSFASLKKVQENKIVFVEDFSDVLSSSLSIMYDDLVENYDFDIYSHFLRNTFVKKLEHIRRSIQMLKEVANAKYIIINTSINVFSNVNIRKETEVVQLWHGCGAFKKFGLSTADLLFGLSRKQSLKYPGYRNETFVSVSSPEVIWAYEEAMNMVDKPGIVQATGVSRTDIFYDQTFKKEAMIKLHNLFPESKGKKVILYAPTFRGRVAKAKIDNVLKFRLFKENLGENYVLVSKHHPFIKKCPVVPMDCRDFARDLTKSMTIEELIVVSDICISDYSSLIYEWSLFEKPIMFFAYDIADYNDWRGFYYNYDELTPGPVFTNNMQMINYVKELENGFDATEINAFKKKFMISCDGKATDRIKEIIFKTDLQKYQRKLPLPNYPYHTVPVSKFYNSKNTNRLKYYIKQNETLNKNYQVAAKVNIVHNRIVLIRKDNDIFTNFLKRKISANFEVLVLDINNLNANIDKLASSAFVIYTRDFLELNGLKYRPETKLIRLTEYSVLSEKTNYDKPSNYIDFYKDYQKFFPLNNNYDLIAIFDNECKEKYLSAFKSSVDKLKAFGSLNLELVRDSYFQESATKKLKELIPNYKNQKIILYAPSSHEYGEKNLLNNPLDFGLMFEYLSDDYLLLYHYGENTYKTKVFNSYYSSFAFDISNELVFSEAIALADVVVGDYSQAVIESSLLKKRVFSLIDQKATEIDKLKYYENLNNLKAGVVVNKTSELINEIKNIDNYNTSNQNKFINIYGRNSELVFTDNLVSYLNAQVTRVIL